MTSSVIPIRDESGAGEPDQLAAKRAGVHHAQIADERDEPARAAIRARWANRRSGGIDGRHAQEAPGGRTGYRVGAGFVPRYARFTVLSGVVAEKTAEEISM